MKKLLLIFLCLPIIGFGQYLPTETTYYQKNDINYPYANKYIERGKAIELGYKEFLKNIDDIMEPKNDPDYDVWGVECQNIIAYYNKFNTITEKMWMNLECVCSHLCYYENELSVKNASSTLFSNNNNKYTINNLTDGDPRTVWAEGKDDYGIGEFFEVDFHHYYGVTSYILNGHQKSIELWKNNSRVKTFKVYYNNEPFCYLELDDNMQKQFFAFNIFFYSDLDLDQFKKYSSYDVIKKMRQDFLEGGAVIASFKFEIIDIYPGEKWKDVCISELKQYEPVGG